MRKNQSSDQAVSQLAENRKKQILIVDDEEGIRFMLETKFSRSGYRVMVAANGLHALQKIRAKVEIDMIVCDLKMPGMTGLEFYQNLRNLGVEIPFLIITGFPDRRTLSQAAKLGVETVLLKPVNQSVLMGHVEKLLNTQLASAQVA